MSKKQKIEELEIRVARLESEIAMLRDYINKVVAKPYVRQTDQTLTWTPDYTPHITCDTGKTTDRRMMP